MTATDVATYGLTGPVAKSAGVKKDLRFLKSETYAHYWFLSIQGYLGRNGDSYDRFLIRLREMYESINIVFQVLNNLSSLATRDGTYPHTTNTQADFFNFFKLLYSQGNAKLNRQTKYTSMERLISHFKYYSEGLAVPAGFTYRAVEAPKGEFGVGLLSDGTSVPYRCKIRTPAYHHMQVMPRMVQGHYFADLVTVLGSLDIVFGDVDR